MSDKKRENLSDEEHGCDENETGTVKVGNGTTNLDTVTQVSHNRSEITDYNQQRCAAEDTEVMPNDITSVQQLSHEPLRENSNGNAEYRVIYEFPSDYENISPFFQACAGNTDDSSSKKCLQESNYSSFHQINKNQEDKLIKVFDIEPLNKKAPDNMSTAGISGETERKRKKIPISLMQYKRQKEAENPCKPLIHLPRQTGGVVKVKFPESDSDEFADTEDNVKDSSSSDSSEAISIEKDLAPKIQQTKERKFESLKENDPMKINLSSASNLDSSRNSKFAEEISFASSLKVETIPALKLSNDAKKKFELSMETILEVPESESDEHVYKPMQSKTNPLKMKTTVGKRKDKCNICNVRLGLCAIKCRCGGYYCAKHRYDKEHNCSFDYRSMGAEEIRKNNPRIVAEKIRKL